MPNIDHPNPFIEAPIVDILDMAATQGEEMANPFLSERFRDQSTAVNHGHV